MSGTCGAWAIEFRDQHGVWKGIIKPGFTKTQAKEAYNEIVRNIQRGLFDLPMLRKMPKVTVEAYSKKYLERIKGIVPENTLVSRQTAVNAIARHLGDIEISKLNVVLVQRFCTDAMEKDGAKPSTVNQYNSVLKLILDMAVREQVIGANPLMGFKRLRTDETSKRVLTDEEIREILNESVLPIGWERMAILFGLFTGIRLMDIMALKWSSVDFNNSTITLIQQKTRRTISLPLSSYLVTELKKYQATVCNSKEYLFHDGEVSHKKQVRYSNHFIRVFRGLGLANITFHSLRHTHASRMVAITKDASLASRMLGHASLNTTMTYIHKGESAKKEAIESFTNHMLAFSRYVPDAELKTA